MNIPENLKYARTHEWVNVEGTQAVIGISDHAQEALGDITFVELPEVGQTLEVGKEFGVIESVKAASDLYAPLGGTVAEVNNSLDAEPEAINKSPYENGWIVKLKNITIDDASSLLDAASYRKLLESEE
ncbi:MAG: glycine cleavage system protein GcvH [Chitinivibrionales bacterium]|nr:glycine cleavage system protein GcvH [Chitinivibrionales bacterium]